MPKSLTFDDILDLTHIQTIILEVSCANPEGRVRNSLLQDVNSRLSLNKELGPSSFYNSLNKLEKMGFIDTKMKSNTIKIKLIKPNSKTFEILRIISMMTIPMGVPITKLYNEIVLPELTKLTGIARDSMPEEKKAKRLFFMSFDDGFYKDTYNSICSMCKEIYILTDDTSFDKYCKRDMTDFQRIHYSNSIIHEPDGYFDGASIIHYNNSKSILGFDKITLLKEIARVLEKNGTAVFQTMIPMIKPGHIVTDEIIELYNAHPLTYSCEVGQIVEELTHAGFVSIQPIVIKGYVMVRAKTPPG